MDVRRKRVLTVFAVASVILAWRVTALVTRFAPSTARGGLPLAAEALAPDPSAPRAGDELEGLLRAQRHVGEQPWGRDPFQDLPGVQPARQVQATPPAAEEKPPSAPRLEVNAVSKSGDEWMAAIQGTIVRVGDRFDNDFRVIRITKRSVTLETQGWEFTYELGVPAPTVHRGSTKR